MHGSRTEELDNEVFRDCNHVCNCRIPYKIRCMLSLPGLARYRHNCYAYTDRYCSLSAMEKEKRYQVVGGKNNDEAPY